MRFLLVDDSSKIRNRMASYIFSLDPAVQCVEASSELEALQLLQAMEFICIVLDLELLEGSGLKVLEYVRSSRISTEVLMFSNCNTEQHRRASRKAGASAFYDKTCDLEVALQHIARIVKGEIRQEPSKPTAI